MDGSMRGGLGNGMVGSAGSGMGGGMSSRVNLRRGMDLSAGKGLMG